MIDVKVGDLFESDAQTWVNTVNCVGVMGKGIALTFKQRFPAYFDDYEERCERDEVQLGEPYLYKRESQPWILSFPTKDHWRSLTRLEHIVEGLEYLEDHYEEWGIESLAVPPLGCGNGQLEWAVVGPTLYEHLQRLDIPIELYAPFGTAPEMLTTEFLTSDADAQGNGDFDPDWIEPGWVALVAILNRIQADPFHNPVGRTMFQKLAYFATEEGIPTQLEHEKGTYGPYAPGLKPAQSKLLNNGLLKEDKKGRMFRIEVGPTYEDARRAYSDALEDWEERMDRVADLMLRTDMNTRRAELIASILFIGERYEALHGQVPTEEEVLDGVLQWKGDRDPPLDPNQVAYYIRFLSSTGWLETEVSEDLDIDDRAFLLA